MERVVAGTILAPGQRDGGRACRQGMVGMLGSSCVMLKAAVSVSSQAAQAPSGAAGMARARPDPLGLGLGLGITRASPQRGSWLVAVCPRRCKTRRSS